MSISSAQKAVADAILKTFNYAIVRGKNGVAFADVVSHLSQFNEEKEAHILANIALKRTFDLVFSQKRKDSKKYPNAVSNVTTLLVHQLRMNARFAGMNSKIQSFYQKIQKKYWFNTTGTQQKRNVAQLMFNREDIKWQSWGAPLRARLGAWLLNIVCETTGWFTKEIVWKVSQSSH